MPLADLYEAQMWARISVKRAILRSDVHALAATRRYLDHLERMTRR